MAMTLGGTFKAKLWPYEGPGGWHFVTVPERLAPPVTHRWGRTPVVDGYAWKTSVWRDKRRRTLLAVPKRARGGLPPSSVSASFDTVTLTPEQTREVDRQVAEIASGPRKQAKAAGTLSSSRGDCVGDCQQRLRDRVAIAKRIFESPGSVYYHNTAWLNDALAAARNEFDSCIAICR